MLPLISCIMPTIPNRRKFVQQAISYFNNQDYPNRELIIIDDGEFDSLSDVVPAQENIEYVWLNMLGTNTPLTIGMKRNLACSLAKGDIICSFDDDDYHGSHRLSKQAEPIIAGEATASAMRMSLLLDASETTLWACSDLTHKLCFKQDIHYGTLMFRASYWRNGTHFANVNVGEDRRFVHALLAQDAQLARVVDPASFIYVLHGRNTTSDMRLVHPDGWEKVELAEYMSEGDRRFYEGLVAVAA